MIRFLLVMALMAAALGACAITPAGRTAQPEVELELHGQTVVFTLEEGLPLGVNAQGDLVSTDGAEFEVQMQSVMLMGSRGSEAANRGSARRGGHALQSEAGKMSFAVLCSMNGLSVGEFVNQEGPGVARSQWRVYSGHVAMADSGEEGFIRVEVALP